MSIPSRRNCLPLMSTPVWFFTTSPCECRKASRWRLRKSSQSLLDVLAAVESCVYLQRYNHSTEREKPDRPLCMYTWGKYKRVIGTSTRPSAQVPSLCLVEVPIAEAQFLCLCAPLFSRVLIKEGRYRYTYTGRIRDTGRCAGAGICMGTGRCIFGTRKRHMCRHRHTHKNRHIHTD